MGFWSNLKDAIFMDEDDDDDDDLYEKEMKEIEKKEKKAPRPEPKMQVKDIDDLELDDGPVEELSPGKAAQERRRKAAAEKAEESSYSSSRPITPPRSPESSYNPSNYVKKFTKPVKKTQDASEIEIYKAKTFSDAQVVCDSLASGVAIIVSFLEMDVEDSQRIMDFICGSIYVLQGNIHTISDQIYLFTPNDVEVSGDYVSMVQKSGFGVPTFNKMI